MARAYNLIEELMIAANEAVGRLAVAGKPPLPFRVHDVPSEEKLQQLEASAFALGTKVDAEKLKRPRGVQKFLSKVSTGRRSGAFSMLMLRAMAQAAYRTENVGHFALASQAYVHFTSPIRRYPRPRRAPRSQGVALQAARWSCRTQADTSHAAARRSGGGGGAQQRT